jgi:trimeric autotransporter adhesin
MSYTIYYSDPSKFNFPIVVQDDTKYNSVGTGGLTLVGRNYPGYGQAVAENFIHILENSASPIPPINPIEGQLWFDTSDPANKKLRINDGAANNTSWRPVNGLHQSTLEPSQVTTGDIWVDTTDNQLKIYNGSEFILVGPNAKGVDFTGPVPEILPAADGNEYEVILNYVEGRVISIISNSRFTPNPVVSGFIDVEVGVTLSNDDFGTIESPRKAKFYGTARTADALILSSGEVISASTVLRNNTNQTLNGQLRISKSTSALALGNSPTFLIGTDSSGADATFSNEIANSNFTFYVKNSFGSQVPILTMGGSDREVLIKSTINSASTTTSGALQVAGGIGVGKDAWIGGDIYFSNRIIAGNIVGTTGQVLTSDVNGIVRWSGLNANAYTGGTIPGTVTISDSSISTSSTSGALVVFGGVGIGGQVNIASLSTATTSSGALRVSGGVSIGGGLYVAGEIIADKLTIQLTTVTTTLVTTDDIIQTRNTLASTSTITGALVVAGGVGIGGTMYVGQSINVGSNIGVGGNITVAGLINATVSGVATSATNVVGGTTGSIPVQSAAGITSYIAPGTAGQFLRSGGTTATFVNTSTIYIDSAVRAEQFRTARTITFTGDVTGSFVLDGTQNTGTALTIQPNSIALGADTNGDYISTGTTTGYGISGGVTGEGTTFNINSNATSSNVAGTIVFRNQSGNFSAGNITAVQFNGSAQGLTNIPGIEIDNGSVRNIALTSSTIGVSAGTAIGLSRTTVSLGDTFTITNLGVQSLAAGAGVSLSASTGSITIGNTGITATVATTYLGISTTNGVASFTNLGVQSITAGAGLSVSAATGTITLTNLGVTTASGTTYLGVSSSTGLVTFTNLGVQTLTGSAYLAVSASTGTVTLTNNGVHTIVGSDYIAVSTSTGTVTLTNNGVQSIAVSGALGVSANTGTITITDLGVRAVSGSTYLGVSSTTGTVVLTNLGVQTAQGSAFIGVSQSTGTITIANNGVQSLSVIGALGVSATTGTITLTSLGVSAINGTTYLGVSASTGTVSLTNLGVQTLTAGTDTSVSASTGTVTVWNNSTLQTITNRGSASSNAIQITNSTPTTSASTGALVVSGGVGVVGGLFVGASATVTSALTVGTTLTLNGATQNLGSSVATSTINLGYGATTTGNTKTVNIGTGGDAGSTTLINIGSLTSNLSSATMNGDLVITGALFLQAGNGVVMTSISTATATTFTGTPTGTTFYFTNISPPKLGIYGASAWRDAIGNILF